MVPKSWGRHISTSCYMQSRREAVVTCVKTVSLLSSAASLFAAQIDYSTANMVLSDRKPTERLWQSAGLQVLHRSVSFWVYVDQHCCIAGVLFLYAGGKLGMNIKTFANKVCEDSLSNWAATSSGLCIRCWTRYSGCAVLPHRRLHCRCWRRAGWLNLAFLCWFINFRLQRKMLWVCSLSESSLNQLNSVCGTTKRRLCARQTCCAHSWAACRCAGNQCGK